MSDARLLFGKPPINPLVVMNKHTCNLMLMRYSKKDSAFVIQTTFRIEEGDLAGVTAKVKVHFADLEKVEKCFEILGEL
jgi:hypothetical protein